MDYAALIENRKSVRSFVDQQVEEDLLREIRRFYEKDCHRLDPILSVELEILESAACPQLEQTAGYGENTVGAPYYLVLFGEDQPQARMNAGYMMEDLVLKLEDLGLQSCFVTLGDPEKAAVLLPGREGLTVQAVIAFGYGKVQEKKLRVNLLSMSCVDVIAQRGYYSPKKDIRDLVNVDTLDNIRGLDEKIGFYEDMLWQSFYAVTKTPSYLNRQPYVFLLKDGKVMLVSLPDPYTDRISADLGLGIAMLHFSVIGEKWTGKIVWDLTEKQSFDLPSDCRIAAVCTP